jgi:hypothetical protein
MRNLESRLSALERSTAPQRVAAIRRCIVEPGALEAPRMRAEFYGQTMVRRADESDDAFELRATVAAKAAAPVGAIPRLCLLGS